MSNHPNRSRHYTIIAREQCGENVRVRFERNGVAGYAIFDRYPGKWELRAHDLFFGINDITNDDLVIRALRYVNAD